VPLIIKGILGLALPAIVGIVVIALTAASGGPSGSPARNTVLVPPADAGGCIGPCSKVVALPSATLQMEATAAPPQSAILPDTPTPEPQPEPEADPVLTMEVRAGDTLNNLAEWFGLSAGEIAVYNGIGDGDYLQIGQVLAIPVPASEFALPPEAYVAVIDEPAGFTLEAEPAAVAAPIPAPTPEPTPPPAPYVPPAATDVVAAICSFPWPCETMVRIASCESGLNPRSMNPAGYYGLFQIDHIFDGWDDPLTNASVAYHKKYLPSLNAGGDGLSPWPYCRYY